MRQARAGIGAGEPLCMSAASFTGALAEINGEWVVEPAQLPA
jgi:hypothetical protein